MRPLEIENLIKLTRRYPLDKFDDEVDVGYFLEILRHQVESVVEAPQTEDVHTSSQVEGEVGVDDVDELCRKPTCLAHHVRAAVGRDRDQL